MSNEANLSQAGRTGEVYADNTDPVPKLPSNNAEIFTLGGFGRIPHRVAQHWERWPRYHREVFTALIALCDNRKAQIRAEVVARRLGRPVRTTQQTIQDLEAWGFIRRRSKSKTLHAGTGFTFADLNFPWPEHLEGPSFRYLEERPPHNRRKRLGARQREASQPSPTHVAKGSQRPSHVAAEQPDPGRRPSPTPAPGRKPRPEAAPPERSPLISQSDHSQTDQCQRSPRGDHCDRSPMGDHSDRSPRGDRSTKLQKLKQKPHQEGTGGGNFEKRNEIILDRWTEALDRHGVPHALKLADVVDAVTRIAKGVLQLGYDFGRETQLYAQRYLLQVSHDPDVFEGAKRPFVCAQLPRHVDPYFRVYDQRRKELARTRRMTAMGSDRAQKSELSNGQVAEILREVCDAMASGTPLTFDEVRRSKGW